MRRTPPWKRLAVLAGALGAACAVASCDGDGRRVPTEPEPPDTVVTALALSPAALSLNRGQHGELIATARDRNGHVIPGRYIEWSTADTGVATVDAAGLVTARRAGVTTVSAVAGDVSATADVTVAPEPVASVALTLERAALSPGATTQATATARDAGGAVLEGRPVTYATSSADVATVSATGVVTAVAPGTATITATVEGYAATATITVAREYVYIPPALVDLALTPARIDVTTAAATVTFAARATGGSDGLTQVRLDLSLPPGETGIPRSCSMSLASGTRTDGTWECTITFPRGSAPGIWAITHVALSDPVSRTRYVSTVELRAAGLPTGVTVTGTSTDVTAPALVALSIAPATVDVSAGAATLSVTARVTDAESGTDGVQLYFASPAPSAAGSRGAGCEMALTSGTGADGTWSCTVTIPQGSTPGTWTLSDVSLVDLLSNFRVVRTPDVAAAGFPTSVEVINTNPDVTAPTLASLSFTPDTIDLRAGPATVTVTARATDAGAGVETVAIIFNGPRRGAGSRGCSMTLVSGTRADGTWSCAITFEPGLLSGTWTVLSVGVADAVGLGRGYDASALAAADLPTSITVR